LMGADSPAHLGPICASIVLAATRSSRLSFLVAFLDADMRGNGKSVTKLLSSIELKLSSPEVLESEQSLQWTSFLSEAGMQIG